MSDIFRLIFRSRAYENARQFYLDLLDCPVVLEWDRGPAERGTVFRVGSGEIEVLALPPGWEYVPPQGFEIAIEVENADKTYSQLYSRGVKIKGELANKPWGHRTFSVNDLDGIKLIFFSII